MASSIRTQGYNKTSSNIFGDVNTSYVEPRKVLMNDTFKKSDIFSDNSPATNNKSRLNNTLKSDIFFSNSKPIQQTSMTTSKKPKTTIFFGDTPSQEFAVKKNKSSNKEYNPDSYYKNETAFTRKLKEFYSTEVDNTTANMNNTFGTLIKKDDEECKGKREIFSNPVLTAKDRKFHEFYSNMTIEEIKKITNSTKKDDLKLNEKKIGVSEYDPTKDTKLNKIEFLKSNIFHDESKKEIYEKFPGNYQEEKPAPKEPPKITVPINPWKAKIDWRDASNELIFQHEYECKDESALERKKKDLKDHFAPERNNLEVPLKPTDDVIESTEKAEIKNYLKESANENEIKLRKKMELSSVIQGKDFYQNIIKCAGKNTRPVSSYVVNDIKDFDSLKVKEIENIFKSKGIHIYDVKTSGSYINGNTNGQLSFKIRENNDVPDFNNQLDDLKSQLKNNMGLEIKPHVKKGRTPSIGCLPSTVRWDDTKIDYFTKKSNHFVKTNNKDYNKTGDKEKFSKTFIKVSTSYKNNTIKK